MKLFFERVMPKYSVYYSTFSFWKQRGPKPGKKTTKQLDEEYKLH